MPSADAWTTTELAAIVSEFIDKSVDSLILSLKIKKIILLSKKRQFAAEY